MTQSTSTAADQPINDPAIEETQPDMQIGDLPEFLQDAESDAPPASEASAPPDLTGLYALMKVAAMFWALKGFFEDMTKSAWNFLRKRMESILLELPADDDTYKTIVDASGNKLTRVDPHSRLKADVDAVMAYQDQVASFIHYIEERAEILDTAVAAISAGFTDDPKLTAALQGIERMSRQLHNRALSEAETLTGVPLVTSTQVKAGSRFTLSKQAPAVTVAGFLSLLTEFRSHSAALESTEAEPAPADD